MAALTKPTVKINNVTYEAVPSVTIQGITDSTGTYDGLDFYWTGDATVTASNMLSGVTAYGPNGVVTGSIIARTGDQDSDSQSTGTREVSGDNLNVVKFSVPDTAYYDDSANITALFSEVAALNIAQTQSALLLSPLSTMRYIIRSDAQVLGINGTFTDSSTVSSGQTAATASQILTGYSAWVNSTEVKGSMPNNGATDGTISTKAGTVSIPSGYTTGGTVSIDSTEQAKIIAGNIKTGVTVLGVAGTFTAANTVSSGQTAAAAGQILSGYSAWVGGSEVKGNIPTRTATNVTVSGKSITTAAGYYATAVTKSVADGTLTPSVALSGGATDPASSSTSYTVSGVASNTGTAGWISDFTVEDTDEIVIPNANITSFDMLSGASTNTSASNLTVQIGHMVSSTPTNYVGYINGGSATINYGTLASAGIATVSGDTEAKSLTQISAKILPDTTILGVTGTCPSFSGDYTADEILAYNDDDNVYVGIPETGFYTDNATIKAKFAGTDSVLAAWDTANSTYYNTNRTATDLSASGKTVTVPAGYYNAQVTKDVSTGTASVNTAATAASVSSSTAWLGTTTSAYKVTVNANPSVTAGWITSIGGTTTKDYYVQVETKTITSANSGTVNASAGKLISAISITAPDASKIKVGETLFGATGTFTADATATASQILSGATAYVNGSKVTGTIANGSVEYTPNTSTAVTTGAGYYATAVTTNVPSVTQDGTTKVLTIA